MNGSTDAVPWERSCPTQLPSRAMVGDTTMHTYAHAHEHTNMHRKNTLPNDQFSAQACIRTHAYQYCVRRFCCNTPQKNVVRFNEAIRLKTTNESHVLPRGAVLDCSTEGELLAVLRMDRDKTTDSITRQSNAKNNTRAQEKNQASNEGITRLLLQQAST